MGSRIHKGKTPNEIILQSAEESIKNFNKHRQKGTLTNRPVLKVGDKVRRTLKTGKEIMYKSNSGSQWDHTVYTILAVTRKQPYRYRLQITEKIKNKVVTHKKWFPRYSLQKLQGDDTESSKLLKSREQSGSLTSKKVKKERAHVQEHQAKFVRRSGRRGAEKARQKIAQLGKYDMI